MKACTFTARVLLVVLMLTCSPSPAQAPQLPMTVEKDKKTVILQAEDQPTKQDPDIAEYMKLIAGELQELYKAQSLGCSWTVSIKLIPKGAIKLLELTLEDKDNRAAPNKITRTALPFEKGDYAEQSKATAKRLIQLLTCAPQT